MKRLIVCSLFFLMAAVLISDFAVAQPGRRPRPNPRTGADGDSDKSKASPLPDDPRLLALHKAFLTDAGKLAGEYERNQDWGRAKSVYEEILKLVPEYPPAKAKLNEMMQRLGSAQRVTVDVDASKNWQNTGVVVLQGQPVTVRAVGSWTLIAEVGPEGIILPKEVRDVKELREANLGSLLGAISTGNPKEDKPFPVGAQKSFTPEKSGQLYLRMHDIETRDNKGTMKIEIVGTFKK